MLRIGKMTDYAMLIMSHMAKTPGVTLSAAALAEVLHLTAPTVSKILKILADADLVTSIRGAEGGYHLSKSAEQITLVDIIAAMEGDLALTECCDMQGLCTIDSLCTLRENWKKVNKMVKSLLSNLTILDMCKPLSEEVLYGK